MRAKLWVAAAVILGIQLVWCGAAAARDRTLSLTVAPSLLKTSSVTGQLTYQLQEAVHNTLTSTAGVEVEHSYIWVEVNGSQILAVDPPKAMFNN